MEEFQDRLYFGTDIANVPQQLPIVAYFAELAQHQLIMPQVHAKISWRNAAALLGID